MYCEKCGNKLEKPDYKCCNCDYTYVSKEITQGVDGIYRWAYGVNMWKNPTVFFTVWKVFLLASSVPTLLVAGMSLFEEGIADSMLVFIQMFGLMVVISTVLALVAYPISALINGGIYQVIFEMDEQGISHTQMQKQFKRNQVLAIITSLAGAAAGSPGTTGAGLLAGSKQSSYSEFSKVTKIKSVQSRHVIYLNAGLDHNQIYVEDADFEFVKNYMTTRCVKLS